VNYSAFSLLVSVGRLRVRPDVDMDATIARIGEALRKRFPGMEVEVDSDWGAHDNAITVSGGTEAERRVFWAIAERVIDAVEPVMLVPQPDYGGV
jgi:hypothetical protein